MAKRKKAYRAYAPGSVQRKVNDQLRHAVSELRHGRKGCKFAKQNISTAERALFDAMDFQGVSRRVYGQTMRKILRVRGVFRSKCGM
jgi:hypothetical protein